MKLTDEIAAAPFKFKEVQIRSFDCNAQQGFCIYFESTVDPEYTYSNVIRFVKSMPEDGITAYEAAVAMENLSYWLKTRFNEDGTFKPERVKRIREQEDEQA